MTEQTFTDELLARLKKDIEPFDNSQLHCMSFGAFRALLARLEAAECNMGGHAINCSGEIRTCTCSKKDRVLAWRKAAGK